MGRKEPAPSTTGDIPAWFMTYSDVVTLLMTFFILLMTFSTHQPERIEKTRVTFFKGTAGTGLVGPKASRPPNDSWVNRIRTRAAKIALRGAEMPPITEDPATEAIGRGLKSLTDEENAKDEMTTHSFEIRLADMVDSLERATPKGQYMAQLLSTQLRQLPVHASIRISQPQDAKAAIAFMKYLFEVEKVRPGQVAVSLTDAPLPAGVARIAIERYVVQPQ
jgi:flagellar motor protein MotB